ncbi:MAG: helix-hairpin-helix domain-containing protein [Tannerellaceae bacterium]|jgi:hypothetical protein|nr:helix-hairpin-helix domain-containing protein [Tannerellaceae bacterium]
MKEYGEKNYGYFSKGESRALVVLLALTGAAWMMLTFFPAPQGTPGLAASPAPTALAAPPPAPAPPPSSDAATTPEDTSASAASPTPEPFYRRAETAAAARKGKFPRREKFPPGTVVELNTADTATLQKVPGIGSTFSRRIVGYRRVLGRYRSVSQLQEIYGMDQERYEALKGWFYVDTTAVSP